VSETCAISRCRRSSVVGVLPARGRTTRFICERHWVKLAALEGSVCANVLALGGKP